MSEQQQQRFNVENMKCGGCVSAVTEALQALDKTEVIDVSLEKHHAVVKSALAAEEIVAAISHAGFPAELV